MTKLEKAFKDYQKLAKFLNEDKGDNLENRLLQVISELVKAAGKD